MSKKKPKSVRDAVSEGSNTLIPAIPPEDYKGSMADWMVALVSRGLWDDSDGSWPGDVMIPSSVWWEILEECEGDDDEHWDIEEES